jgi:hypothetical protein
VTSFASIAAIGGRHPGAVPIVLEDAMDFTHAQVLEVFGYDSATGSLLWKIVPSPRVKSGAVAGVVASNGRRYVTFNGKRYLAHRLVWFHQTGEWPTDNIVPINGDYLDTRIANLRSETASETAIKGTLRGSNKSGVKGVSWDTVRQCWQVHAYRDYRTVSLGRFKQLADAINCKRNADIGVFAHDTAITEANKDRKAINSESRRLWARLQKWSSGSHGWASLAEFYAEVGSQPATDYFLVPIAEDRPLGPGNWKWSAPMFKRRTREGRIAAGKAHREANYAMYRDKQLRRTFGIGSNEYDAMVAEQNGVCAICAQPETALRKGKVLPLCVDHNHRTGENRGLLCTACNIGIGSLAESPERLRAAIAYLDRWNAIETAPLPDNVVKLKN